MKKLVALAAALALAMAAALGLAGCGNSSSSSGGSQQPAEKVVIGTLATEDILPFWVAEDQGLFQEAGVDASIQTFQSATELIAAVSAGEVQMAMTDPMVSASIYASGTDVQIEWITLGATAEQGRFGILTADPSVKSLEDLAGKEVGVGSNTILEYVLDCLMERAGVPAEQVVTAELQKLPVRYQACVSGQVPAAALPASLLALGEANGCTVVADDTTGENISQSVMIANSAFAASEGGAAAIEALKSVWDEAAAAVNANPESFRSLLAEKASLPEQIADSYPVSEYPSCQLPSQEQVDKILDWMKAKGYLADGITYDAATGCFSGR
ncbi:MAG: ABC transporter substrate-binding protein [Coriobacteriales bacterium]